CTSSPCQTTLWQRAGQTTPSAVGHWLSQIRAKSPPRSRIGRSDSLVPSKRSPVGVVLATVAAVADLVETETVIVIETMIETVIVFNGVRVRGLARGIESGEGEIFSQPHKAMCEMQRRGRWIF